MSTQNLSSLFDAAKVASGVSMQEVRDSSCLLDDIMIFLCERIDLELSAFKGGYVLSKIIPTESRATRDIGMSISEKSDYEYIKIVLKDLGNKLLKDGVIESYIVKPDISEKSSGGITMKLHNTKQLSIDIGWHDLIWGVQYWEHRGFNCRIFEVERMLADKISAMYSKRRFRHTKDLYDFYILTNNFDVDLPKLVSYIDKRGTIDWDDSPFTEDILVEYGKAYEKLNIITYDNRLLSKPRFAEIVLRLRDFMGNCKSNLRWNHVSRKFEEI